MRFDGFRSIVESMRIVHQYKPTRNGNRHDPMNLLNTQMNDDYISNQELPRHNAGRAVPTCHILCIEA